MAGERAEIRIEFSPVSKQNFEDMCSDLEVALATLPWRKQIGVKLALIEPLKWPQQR
jgi:hypothetical protein